VSGDNKEEGGGCMGVNSPLPDSGQDNWGGEGGKERGNACFVQEEKWDAPSLWSQQLVATQSKRKRRSSYSLDKEGEIGSGSDQGEGAYWDRLFSPKRGLKGPEKKKKIDRTRAAFLDSSGGRRANGVYHASRRVNVRKIQQPVSGRRKGDGLSYQGAGKRRETSFLAFGGEERAQYTLAQEGEGVVRMNSAWGTPEIKKIGTDRLYLCPS